MEIEFPACLSGLEAIVAAAAPMLIWEPKALSVVPLGYVIMVSPGADCRCRGDVEEPLPFAALMSSVKLGRRPWKSGFATDAPAPALDIGTPKMSIAEPFRTGGGGDGARGDGQDCKVYEQDKGDDDAVVVAWIPPPPTPPPPPMTEESPNPSLATEEALLKVLLLV